MSLLLNVTFTGSMFRIAGVAALLVRGLISETAKTRLMISARQLFDVFFMISPLAFLLLGSYAKTNAWVRRPLACLVKTSAFYRPELTVQSGQHCRSTIASTFTDHCARSTWIDPVHCAAAIEHPEKVCSTDHDGDVLELAFLADLGPLQVSRVGPIKTTVFDGPSLLSIAAKSVQPLKLPLSINVSLPLLSVFQSEPSGSIELSPNDL